jgi:ClpP class serine protease
MPGQPEEHRQGNRAGLISLLVAALTAAPARAVEASAERPTLPSWSTAGDDGAAALWSNPANLALDPSPSWFILYQQNVDQDAPGRLAMATNLGPLGAGLSYRSASVDGTVPAWWSLSAALSLRLDQQFGIGGAVGWQIPEGDQQNFALWDLGASWRPLTWFGMSAVSRNVGSDQARVDPRFGPAVAFRPWGDKVTLGLDYLLSNNVTTPGAFAANLRLHPREGLVVRGSVDQVGTLGAGLEIYFGRSGMGAHGYLPTNGGVANLALYGASTAPEERLIGHGHRVPTFRIADSYPYNPPSAFFLGESAESYLHLLQRLERAARDPGVDGIVLELDATPFSLAQIEELRAVLAVAKLNKKPIYVYLDKATSNGAYLLAASADKVFLHPAGELSLIGLSMELQFFRSTLDLVGVKAQFARRSEYKSGPEQYTSSEASPGTREEMESLVDDLSAAWRRGIADSRGKTDEQILKLVDGGPYTAAEALEKGLVDRLAYPDEFEKEVDAAFDGEANFDESYGVEDAANGWRASREIAVIYVVGEIVTGESGYSGGLLGGGSAVTGGDTFSRRSRTTVSAISVMSSRL